MSNLVQSAKGALLLGAIVALIAVAATLFAEPFYQRIVFIFMVNLIAVIGLQVFMGMPGSRTTDTSRSWGSQPTRLPFS